MQARTQQNTLASDIEFVGDDALIVPRSAHFRTGGCGHPPQRVSDGSYRNGNPAAKLCVYMILRKPHPETRLICVHIWTINDWEKNIQDGVPRRTGIRFRYERSVDPEVKRACTQFASWLRSEYRFPMRVLVYIKGAKTIRTNDGDEVVGSFFEPFSYSEEPYIRIATGDYEELANHLGKDSALATILASLAHELTHYYQWINKIPLTPIGRERQAAKYANYIVDEYSLTREHP